MECREERYSALLVVVPDVVLASKKGMKGIDLSFLVYGRTFLLGLENFLNEVRMILKPSFVLDEIDGSNTLSLMIVENTDN